MMERFISNPERDAWKTIRGFVQQVDLTVLRWVQLPAGFVLELERGEDIDRIAAQIGPAPTRRMLEQVKVSESSVTLRAKASVELLANLAEHRKSNPLVPLLVRLTTTATRGIESPPIVEGRAAIDVWEELTAVSSFDRLTSEQAVLLRSLRTGVVALSRPESFSKDTWAVFRAFIDGCTDESFFDYAHSVEWSTAAPLTADVAEQVRQLLLATRLAVDVEQARQLGDRLFVHVFRVLTARGLKRLTPEDLRRVVAEPTLAASDHQLLLVLRESVAALGVRIGIVEEQLASDLVAELGRRQGIEATLIATVDLSVLHAPVPANPLCPRVAAAKGICETLAARAWLHVHGPVEIGRRQLVLQVLAHLGSCRAWLRCGEFDPRLSARALEAMFVQFAPGAPGLDRFDRFVQALGPSPVVVLQDVPAIVEDDAFGQKLVSLAQALGKVGGRLITTGILPLPRLLVARRAEDVIDVEAPEFSEMEVADWLRAAGASDQWHSPAYVRFVRAIGLAHGRLIAEVIAYLESQQWRFTEEQLSDMARQEHARDAREAASLRVRSRLPDPATRDLLYRLNLIAHPFDEQDVVAVAGVVPVIDRPAERLSDLRTLCIDPTATQGRYRVSPLFGGIGEIDIPERVRRECHVIIGDRIVRRGTMDVLDLLRALHHFATGGNPGRASVLLLMGLEAATREPKTSATELLASIWGDSDTPLPLEVELPLRILLRAFQVVVRSRVGMELNHLLSDLDRMVTAAAAPYESLAVVQAGLRIAIEFSGNEPAIAYRYMPAVYRHLPRARLPDGSAVPWPDSVPLETMLFVNSGGIRSSEVLVTFLDAAEAMSVEARRTAQGHPVALDASYLVPQRVLQAEGDRASGKEDWKRLRERMTGFAARAQALDVRPLAASCSAAAADVIIRHEGRAADAVSIVDRQLAGLDSVGKLVLAQIAGSALLAKGHRDDAIRLLSIADEQPGGELPEQRIHAAAALSRAWEADPKGKALVYALRAVAIAETYTTDSPHELTRALGELSVAQQIVGNISLALSALDRVGGLLRMHLGDPLSDQFIPPWGHVLAFIGAPKASAESGHPPPQRGMFYMAHAYTPQKPSTNQLYAGAGMLALLADAYQLDDIAVGWARYTQASAASAGDIGGQVRMQQIMGAEDVLHHEWTTLIKGSRLVSLYEQLAVAAPVFPASDVDQFLTNAARDLSDADRRAAAQRAAFRSVMPAIYEITRLCVAAPESVPQVVGEIVTALNCDNPVEAPWAECGQLIGKLHDQGAGGDAIVEQFGSDPSRGIAVRALAYQIASLLFSNDLQSCFAAQVTPMPQVEAALGKRGDPTFRRVVVPAIELFWRRTFEERPILFGSPALFRRALGELAGKAAGERIRHLFRNLRFSLDVELPGTLSDWLSA